MMNISNSVKFMEYVIQTTGRVPVVYANDSVTKALNKALVGNPAFAKSRLWYARFKRNVTDFPSGTWKTYTIWQFSSEINCSDANREACLYTVPGTAYDMDVDVYNGTIEELKSKWPFA